MDIKTRGDLTIRTPLGTLMFGYITGWYKRKDLDINMGRGQAYDGASNMSSENVGLGQDYSRQQEESLLLLHVSSSEFSYRRGL